MLPVENSTKVSAFLARLRARFNSTEWSCDSFGNGLVIFRLSHSSGVFNVWYRREYCRKWDGFVLIFG